MYKLLIVEDEEIFRNVLPVIVDWKAIGFEVAGVCENGGKALEFLERTEVDAILADIRMPVINGLELAMETKSRYPKTKITLFSAFNEFDYAKQGIECGVDGYILKSEGEDEIVRHFTKLKLVLDQENQMRMTDEAFWMKRESRFKEMLKAYSDTENKKALTNLVNRLFANRPDLRLSLFQLDEYRHLVFSSGADRVESIQALIRGYLYQHIEGQGKGSVIPFQELFCVVWSVPEAEFVPAVMELYGDLKEELWNNKENDEECLALSCIYGDRKDDAHNLCHSFVQLRSSICLHKAYIGDCILHESELGQGGKLSLPFSEQDKRMKEIIPLINGKTYAHVMDYFEALKNQWIAAKYTDIDSIAAFAVKLVFALDKELAERGKRSESLSEKSNGLIKEIGYCETIAMVFSKLEAYVTEAFAELNEETPLRNSRVVDEAIAYIRQHYAEPISLEQLAKYVNVHPVHLSRLFSKDIGKTFKQVLIEVRIEEAKKHLKGIHYRIYEISNLVGYEKPRYFSELFRSMTGLTPLEYREKCKG
ncbi:response regulator transcription factor [Paenibacillus arenilitoris]|uniref:Response regulator n=1 Tax=Paenibacillus arenilitoris TaxID=2772299 RepID=A0A927H509_9BACL|nr:response regulator [Paenibacillus arenilitoris]MBD2868981.1 response regulator [Paenibacillus arenilitoris]